MFLYLLIVFAISVNSLDIPQDIKSIKTGGNGGFRYNAGANLMRFFNNTGGNGRNATIKLPLDFERGVCYIEVPTASLVKDRQHIPAGNGSEPHLSRIRSCCKGYVRNIYNFKICDPVCIEECINGLCTAPNTCTCYPEHVRNLAGFCIPTCPIGCQNGRCEGGECLCRDGYKLDNDGRFCVPSCKEHCGGLGNCTSPNTCQCNDGFEATADGSCAPKCEKCFNGFCSSPNKCECRNGYRMTDQNVCEPVCTGGCGGGECIAPEECRCPRGFGRNGCRPAESNQICTNGVYMDGNCVCHAGYILDPTGRCQAMGCENGVSMDGSCACFPGFSMDRNNQSRCIPINDQGCSNGVLMDGTCVCNPGHIVDRSDVSQIRCVPSCSGGCINGVCSSPNHCICYLGYVKDNSVKGRPRCVKRTRRSLNDEVDVAGLLTFEIPEEIEGILM